jgi:hypothetical protein
MTPRNFQVSNPEQDRGTFNPPVFNPLFLQQFFAGSAIYDYGIDIAYKFKIFKNFG